MFKYREKVEKNIDSDKKQANNYSNCKFMMNRA